MYYNIDKVLQTLYLPYVAPKTNNNLLSNHTELYFLLKITSYFMLALYSYILINKLLFSKTNEKTDVALCFIYTKHLRDILLSPNYTIMEYELNRCVMWGFTTPLMLKMYCDVNDITLWDINIHYHLLGIGLHIFIVPFKGQPIYLITSIVFCIPEFLFLKTLHKHKRLPFTNVFILIWIVFILINSLEITKLCNPAIIHAFYNLGDTLCKFICNIVISNYNEQELIVRENMDLQSVEFVSHVIKSINQFETDNKKRTPFCTDLMRYCKKKFVDKIPKESDKLKLELLKKLLPFDMDMDYIGRGRRGGGAATATATATATGSKKEFTFICVMFTDIVNYTELANRYKNCDTIFYLLDDIYECFDKIIKKYSHLQKIETIGDAYMVVGDIYRQPNELNHKTVVKEIIELGLEYIREIKTIKTPDGVPLCIRVGINIGNVNVGILGNEIPRVSVVGNTVNIAARLQSTADSDTIQMSRHVYEHAEETDFGMDIKYITKENVFLKNIGSTTTYNIIPSMI
jgi:class 3 adenylate cyclase